VVYLSGPTNLPNGQTLGLIGMAVAIAISLQVITSTLLGAVLPLGVSKLKFDPAVVASPALASVVDITGTFIYFTIAKRVLGIG
jgi:magnesium transporter